MNLLVIGFSVKSMVLLGAGGIALGLLPRAVEMIVDMSMKSMSSVVG